MKRRPHRRLSGPAIPSFPSPPLHEVPERGYADLILERLGGANRASSGSFHPGHADADGRKCAMACVVLPAFHDAHPEEGGWQVLARWIDDNLNYSQLWFMLGFLQ